MSAIRFPVSVELVLPMAEFPMRAESLRYLSLSVRHLAAMARDQWRDAATHSVQSGRFMNSIMTRDLGDFSAEAYSDLPYAKVVEEGAPARDLKRMLDTSFKVRRFTKTGKRYLIIPFRWGIPNTVGFGRNVMSAEAHALAQALKPSYVTGTGSRTSETGAWDVRTRAPMKIGQRQYFWDGRLRKDDLHAAGIFGTAARHMAGMVKFQNPSADGGSKHTGYMTFRVMVEGSKGWMAPATPGKHYARDIANQMRPMAKQIMGAALEKDLRNVGLGAP